MDTLHKAFLWPNQMVKERNKHTHELKTAIAKTGIPVQIPAMRLMASTKMSSPKNTGNGWSPVVQETK
jgi:hypothetical protein